MKQNLTLKTVRQHIEGIKDQDVREKCLAGLDERCADMECYSVEYAIMLGVNQPGHERSYWEKAYWTVYTESPDYEDTSKFYKLQEVQQDNEQSGKKK